MVAVLATLRNLDEPSARAASIPTGHDLKLVGKVFLDRHRVAQGCWPRAPVVPGSGLVTETSISLRREKTIKVNPSIGGARGPTQELAGLTADAGAGCSVRSTKLDVSSAKQMTLMSVSMLRSFSKKMGTTAQSVPLGYPSPLGLCGVCQRSWKAPRARGWQVMHLIHRLTRRDRERPRRSATPRWAWLLPGRCQRSF